MSTHTYVHTHTWSDSVHCWHFSNFLSATQLRFYKVDQFIWTGAPLQVSPLWRPKWKSQITLVEQVWYGKHTFTQFQRLHILKYLKFHPFDDQNRNLGSRWWNRFDMASTLSHSFNEWLYILKHLKFHPFDDQNRNLRSGWNWFDMASILSQRFNV